MQRFGLRDDQWERIKDFLPGREGHVGGNAEDNRLFVDAVLYRYRTGVPWRDLPARFGDWKIVHQRFSRWAKSGVFDRIFKLLASDPDNVKVYIIMGVAGLNDPSVLPDSAQYAKKAIELIETGKPFAPLFEGNKDKVLANLNYTIAKATIKSSPAEAIPVLLKVARYESEWKKSWQVYYDLATAYKEGPRAKLTDEYKTKIAPDGTETPESKLVLANLNQMIDRQIDALARAVAFSDAEHKKAITDELTELYKYRNKSDAGLAELIASAPSKPLPEMPAPITSLPSTTTGGSPSGNNGASQPGTTSGAKPAGNTGPTGTATGTQTTKTGGAKPAATPTPKPPRRSNHRRG